MAQVLVLCYHALSVDWDADLSVTPEAFERHIAFLLRRGWRPATFSQAVVDRRPGRVVAVTFDDAFASVRDRAAPILDRLGVPATVFAPTAFMDGGADLEWPGVAHWQQSPFASELAAMDWADLRRLADAGWEIGSHTHTHPHLTTLDDDALRRELVASREFCAEALDRPCRSIAYPYGDVDERVAAAAAAAGYEAGAKLSADLHDEGPLRAPRIGIYHPDTWRRFRLKVAGPVRRLRRSSRFPAR
ncbi:MAG TPA: polysaccharide deacetylase family protein [Solirubrobacteraceae bacterium]|nr:polysaccharide deacetylase family protein [Solirubrobacteraceae bacterium]